MGHFPNNMVYHFRMYDTSSSSSSSESEDGEEEIIPPLSRKLQETPSLAKVQNILSIEEAGEAAKISNVPISVGGFFAGGVPGKIRTRESFGEKREKEEKRKRDEAKRDARDAREVRRESLVGYARTVHAARFERKGDEKVVTRKQTLKARHLGGRQIFKRAITTSSSSSEDEEEEQRGGVQVFKRWNVIDSDEEEGTVGQAGEPRPDKENKSTESSRGSHKTSKNVGPEEAGAREEVLREHTPPSSSLGPSPPNSPVQPSVQEAIDSLERDLKREERRREKEAKKRKEEMLEEMMLRLLEERGKRCTEEREKELLRTAAHMIKCKKGCDDARYSNV